MEVVVPKEKDDIVGVFLFESDDLLEVPHGVTPEDHVIMVGVKVVSEEDDPFFLPAFDGPFPEIPSVDIRNDYDVFIIFHDGGRGLVFICKYRKRPPKRAAFARLAEMFFQKPMVFLEGEVEMLSSSQNSLIWAKEGSEQERMPVTIFFLQTFSI
jgi:hypothetical protein